MGRWRLGVENSKTHRLAMECQGDLNHTHKAEETSRKVLRSYQNESAFVLLLSVYCERFLLHGVGLSMHSVTSNEDRCIASKQVENNHDAIRNGLDTSHVRFSIHEAEDLKTGRATALHLQILQTTSPHRVHIFCSRRWSTSPTCYSRLPLQKQ
jgi:hypothetical protein